VITAKVTCRTPEPPPPEEIVKIEMSIEDAKGLLIECPALPKPNSISLSSLCLALRMAGVHP
jgi:hypothetical protein